MDEPYIVYVRTDELSRVIEVNSSEFIADTTGWVEIDRGYGDHCHHAQGNYFPQPIRTEEGVYKYKLVDGVPVERTAEEIAADIAALPAQDATEADYVAALEELGVQFDG